MKVKKGMMRNHGFYVLLFLVSFLGLCRCADADDKESKRSFALANLLYKENKYAEAIAEYEKILNAGFENGSFYYNLANSYFKEGELGKAVVNYERAKLFIPNDSDLKVNHDYAKSLLGLDAQPITRKGVFKWIDKAFEAITLNYLTIILALLQTMIFLLLILKLWLNSARRFLKPFIISLSLIFILGCISLKRKIAYIQRCAVVVSKEIESKFEPLESATTHFTLGEGSKVEVIESNGVWRKIRRFDGKAGWVMSEGLQFISS